MNLNQECSKIKTYQVKTRHVLLRIKCVVHNPCVLKHSLVKNKSGIYIQIHIVSKVCPETSYSKQYNYINIAFNNKINQNKSIHLQKISQLKWHKNSNFFIKIQKTRRIICAYILTHICLSVCQSGMVIIVQIQPSAVGMCLQ